MGILKHAVIKNGLTVIILVALANIQTLVFPQSTVQEVELLDTFVELALDLHATLPVARRRVSFKHICHSLDTSQHLFLYIELVLQLMQLERDLRFVVRNLGREQVYQERGRVFV